MFLCTQVRDAIKKDNSEQTQKMKLSLTSQIKPKHRVEGPESITAAVHSYPLPKKPHVTIFQRPRTRQLRGQPHVLIRVFSQTLLNICAPLTLEPSEGRQRSILFHSLWVSRTASTRSHCYRSSMTLT